MRSSRRIVVALTTAAAVAVPATLAAPAYAQSDYYDRCIAKQRAAWRGDVRDIGRFWADLVWIGREAACRNGWTQL